MTALLNRSTIHTHLCWCLLLAHLVLLLGLDATSLYPLCYAVAVTLHFLFLAAFSWMLAEGYSCQRTCAKCPEKAPIKAFSLLKAPTTTLTFNTLLRHYAKLAFKHGKYT